MLLEKNAERLVTNSYIARSSYDISLHSAGAMGCLCHVRGFSLPLFITSERGSDISPCPPILF